MGAEDKEIIKLKTRNPGAVIASSGYADTLMEELTVAGLTLIDTEDEELAVLVTAYIVKTMGLDFYRFDKANQEVFLRSGRELLANIKARQFRKKKIGKVPGKKPKK